MPHEKKLGPHEIKGSARDGRKAAPNRVEAAREKWSAARKEARPARDQGERTKLAPQHHTLKVPAGLSLVVQKYYRVWTIVEVE
ncbi:hypothetical protein Q75_03920 [Bacillus coahuilensis p1.1.43]|uniref:Uncharacterized protein n=1 Tax=Bacillus coahuilensis p1.1.43 TaxID=1150625 RepID=A0A147KB03_9BACI|nr:hypothetical protein Q75_03920 [Bacillus coahuilensis p1.1.43]